MIGAQQALRNKIKKKSLFPFLHAEQGAAETQSTEQFRRSTASGIAPDENFAPLYCNLHLLIHFFSLASTLKKT
jgi:hypothetical protein